MKNPIAIRFLACVLLAHSPSYAAQSATKDWRNLANALAEIPSEGYCDQPYLVINGQGAWVCVMTTGAGREGATGQHIVSTISQDLGRTWSPLNDIEPANGPEASWVVPFIAPSGRIYAIYTYNSDNMRTVKDVNGKEIRRVDTLGKLMVKYSDDGGYTWSKQRYNVPMRNFQIDRENVYGGKIQFFWSISKPIVVGTDVFMGMGKVGNFGAGFMHTSEGCILKSANLLTETDPNKVRWETLPEGEIGIRPLAGLVADEHNVAGLSDGSIFCCYRTVAGFAGQAYSRDDGRSWQTDWLRYSPGGKRIKQPRCLNKVCGFSNGKYLLFFHNNSTTSYAGAVRGNRNPTWIAGGIEREGHVYWTQPEVFLYDDDYFKGISYPDWLELNGRYFISETQKETARIHEVPAEFLEMLWGQFDRGEITEDGLALDLRGEDCAPKASITLPRFQPLSSGNGLALEFEFQTGDLEQPEQLFSNRLKETPSLAHGAQLHRGQGLEITLLPDGQIQVLLDSVTSKCLHLSGNRVLRPHHRHHLVLNIDGAAKVLSLVVDGDLLDGGEEPYGFTRFSPFLHELNGEKKIQFNKALPARVHTFRVYNRYLRTTEAIGNYRIVSEPSRDQAKKL